MAANPTTENPTTFARVPALVAPVEVVAAAAEPVEFPFVAVLLLAPLATAPLVVATPEAFPDVVVTVEMPPIPLTQDFKRYYSQQPWSLFRRAWCWRGWLPLV